MLDISDRPCKSWLLSTKTQPHEHQSIKSFSTFLSSAATAPQGVWALPAWFYSLLLQRKSFTLNFFFWTSSSLQELPSTIPLLLWGLPKAVPCQHHLCLKHGHSVEKEGSELWWSVSQRLKWYRNSGRHQAFSVIDWGFAMGKKWEWTQLLPILLWHLPKAVLCQHHICLKHGLNVEKGSFSQRFKWYRNSGGHQALSVIYWGLAMGKWEWTRLQHNLHHADIHLHLLHHHLHSQFCCLWTTLA